LLIRANLNFMVKSAKESLNEIREMHKAWEEKLARRTVEGELSAESDDGTDGSSEISP